MTGCAEPNWMQLTRTLVCAAAIASLAACSDPAGPRAQSAPESGAAATTGAAAARSSSLSATDRNFILTAAESGAAEIELGRLAQQRAANPAIRQFGGQMVTEHSRAQDELTAIARNKGIEASTDLDARHRAMRDTLSKLPGAAFDQQYLQGQVEDHEAAISAFQREGQQGQDGDLTAFARRSLPMLTRHLDEARDLARGGGL
jgi:putative membrane protein